MTVKEVLKILSTYLNITVKEMLNILNIHINTIEKEIFKIINIQSLFICVQSFSKVL